MPGPKRASVPPRWFLMLLPFAFGACATLAGPAIWFFDFTWDWIAHDNVIAVGNLERSVRSGMRPLEAFGIGAVIGLFYAAILVAKNWLDKNT